MWILPFGVLISCCVLLFVPSDAYMLVLPLDLYCILQSMYSYQKLAYQFFFTE